MFIEEIKNELEISNDITDKITVFSNKFVIIEGFKKLIEYNRENITLLIKNKRVLILGKELKIAKINNTEILIKGKITSVNFDE